jgi:phosphoribosyl-AMP cyclohydrolase
MSRNYMVNNVGACLRGGFPAPLPLSWRHSNRFATRITCSVGFVIRGRLLFLPCLSRYSEGTAGDRERIIAMTDTIEHALAEIKFGADGLVPAVAQQHDTGEILMMAWMNREAVQVSLSEGRACYWSRSRRQLWRKGETSGQVQILRELRIDCDGDAVLLLVDQQGVACHTGRRSCFFRAWREGRWAIIAEPQIPSEALYPNLAPR